MGLPVEQRRRYTVEEYLRLEASTQEKHEYRNGEIVSMAGGTATHSLIIANTSREAGNALKGSSCRVYDSNLRVRAARSALYTYPDASVVCGPPQFDPKDVKQTTILNPRVIIEVLSPSTEGYDRGDKFDQYCKIDSLEEFLLVAQNRPSVHSVLRQADGTWLLTPFFGLEAVAKVRCLGIEIPLTEIYAGVEFPPEPTETNDVTDSSPTP